jgi:hypothetical protein
VTIFLIERGILEIVRQAHSAVRLLRSPDTGVADRDAQGRVHQALVGGYWIGIGADEELSRLAGRLLHVGSAIIRGIYGLRHIVELRACAEESALSECEHASMLTHIIHQG